MNPSIVKIAGRLNDKLLVRRVAVATHAPDTMPEVVHRIEARSAIKPVKPIHAAPQPNIPVTIPHDLPSAAARSPAPRKYDQGAISKRAHIIKREQHITWGEALKKSWAEARGN